MENSRIYKNKNASKNDTLFCQIEKLLDIPPVKLVSFFASQDNNNRPDWKDKYDVKYDLQGFYLNRKIESIIPNPWPEEIEAEIRSISASEHFVWISNAICNSSDIYMAWLYAHELQHLLQVLKNKYILIVSSLLDYAKYEIHEVDKPTEIESEITAKRIVTEIFGKYECESFLKNMKKTSRYNSIRYDKLLKLSVDSEFNVVKAVQKDICANKSHMKYIQKLWVDNELTDWDIDIDNLCNCQDPHRGIISSVKKR